MKSKKFIVYKHTSPSKKCYIGITCQQPIKRFGVNGKNYLYNKTHTKHPYFYNAIMKYGWDNFQHEILYKDLDELQAKIMEISLIRFYKKTNQSYNATQGGDGVVTNRAPWNKGKKLPDYVIQKLKQKHISDQHKEILRQAHLGKYFGKQRNVNMYDYNGQFIKTYIYAEVIAKELNLHSSNILKVLHRERNHVNGYQFRYTDDIQDVKKLDHINYMETYNIKCLNCTTGQLLCFNSWMDFPRMLGVKVKRFSDEIYCRDDKMYYRNWQIIDYKPTRHIQCRQRTTFDIKYMYNTTTKQIEGNE